MSDDYSSPIRRNWCDGPGAVEVAERLRNHWRDRGAEIRTRFETTLRSESDGRVTVQSVRSDMVNGLPRGWSSAKGWQSIGEIAGRVVRQCGEDIRDHQIKMRTELNKQAHVAGHTPRTNNPQFPKGFEGGQS
jgi:hypothetical protein